MPTNYEKYRKNVNFIKKYSQALNAATGSEVDANANVESKNIATCQGEMNKKEIIGTNRLLMHDKIKELYGVELADEYIRQLESHEIYKHDETSIAPYCVSITMYPFLFNGLKTLGCGTSAPKHLQSFCGSFINLVYAVSSQFAGAVATPEFLTYLDYFIRKEFGDDYFERLDEIAVNSKIPQTIDDMIVSYFNQIVYSINTPASARNFQAVFWNIAYFDKPYFDGIFEDFVFPDGTAPQWESVSWLQKRFMKWFNKERLKDTLTFPVETMNLLNDGSDAVDKEYADFASKMYAEGHSFFTYTSDSVDSLASCCFAPDTKILAKSSDGVHLMSIEQLHNVKWADKRNLTVFHNGSWVAAKTIELPARQMYRLTTSNKKVVETTDNHLWPTLNGLKRTDELTTDDYLMFNTRVLSAVPERNRKLTYNQGLLVGMYLGDGSIDVRDDKYYMTNYSLNAEKYASNIHAMNAGLRDCGITKEFTLDKEYNNVYPVRLYGQELVSFIREYVAGNHANEKSLNEEVFCQSDEFRRGILDGFYATDGGNSNRMYTTSERLASDLEALCSTLGLATVVDVVDRTDEPVVIRGQVYNRNYPLYCLRYYDPKNKRSMGDVFRVVNNSIYFKIASIEKLEEVPYTKVYCFECRNQDEPYFTLPCGLITHNCRLRNAITENVFSYTLGAGGIATGSKGVMTMNINRLVQNAVRDGRDISEAVTEQVDKIHKYLTAYNEIIKGYFKDNMLPVYNAGFISLDKQYLTVGINGFVEGAEFLGIDISPNEEYFNYGEMILKPIFESNKAARTKDLMFNTEFVPAENLGVKNAKWDREDGYVVPRDCYNSYFYKVEDDTVNVVDKFVLHGKKLTKYLDGGSAYHCNLAEHLSQKQYRELLKVAIKEGCSYFTYNIPNTICNKCGHISKHYVDHCLACGSEDVDYASRVIGYLKRISKYSKARQEEAAKRSYQRMEYEGRTT